MYVKVGGIMKIQRYFPVDFGVWWGLSYVFMMPMILTFGYVLWIGVYVSELG